MPGVSELEAEFTGERGQPAAETDADREAREQAEAAEQLVAAEALVRANHPSEALLFVTPQEAMIAYQIFQKLPGELIASPDEKMIVASLQAKLGGVQIGR